MTKNPQTAEMLEQAQEEGLMNENELFFPFIKQSGLYTKSNKIIFNGRVPQNFPLSNTNDQVSITIDVLNKADRAELKFKPFYLYEEFRLDVDGYYPQMTASGYLKFPGVYYIAKLKKLSKTSYTGSIWYKYGKVTSFPYTKIKVKILNPFSFGAKKVRVKFYGPGGITKSSTYKYASPYYHKVNFEYDCESGQASTLSVNTGDHPNKPASLPNQNLTLDKIYRRAGFSVTRGDDNVVPSALKGANGKWSDQEMHDAMQIYWSKFSNSPNWALWTFFAKQHDSGSSLGGVMFDDIGPNHRQGTAIFNDSFINNAPAGDPNPVAWRRRMRFWTAAHEMGHAFNLAHSWQKSLGAPYGNPWIPLANEPEARSFMNYPYNVSGGQSSFFSNFEYRFSNNELLFMRHAPSPFVQMGNSAWFTNHGFSDDGHDISHDLKVELRLNKAANTVEFLEPVYIEVKLTNTTNAPIAVDAQIINSFHDLAIEIQKPNGQHEVCKPFVQYLRDQKQTTLKPGESLYASHFVSAGPDKWYIKEPGQYTLTARLFEDDKYYISDPVKLSVLNPISNDEVVLSNRYFSEQVARVLFFDGSKVLEEGNNVLSDVMDRMPNSNAALHAAISLATPLTRDYKVLTFEDETTPELMDAAANHEGAIKVIKPNLTAAMKILSSATKDLDKMMDSFGHIETEKQIDAIAGTMSKQKSKASAKKLYSSMIDKFEKRGVKKNVLTQLKKQLEKI